MRGQWFFKHLLKWWSGLVWPGPSLNQFHPTKFGRPDPTNTAQFGLHRVDYTAQFGRLGSIRLTRPNSVDPAQFGRPSPIRSIRLNSVDPRPNSVDLAQFRRPGPIPSTRPVTTRSDRRATGASDRLFLHTLTLYCICYQLVTCDFS